MDLSGGTTLHGPVSVTFQEPTAVSVSGVQAGSPAGEALMWPLVLAAGLAAMALAYAARRSQARAG